jgi:hypothetical protein
LGEDTQVQMLSSRLSDVRLRLLSGSAVIEADEIEKSNSITAVVRDSEVHLLRSGLYRLDAVEEESPRLRVLNGEALVTTPGGEFRLKSKKEIELAGDPQARKFDPEDTDALDRWSKRRASYLSVANLSASRMAYRSGLSYSSSSWMWSPFFGMFTYLPYRDVIWSPYGYGFYSPRAVYYLYNPPRNNTAIQSASRGPAYNSTYGYNTVGQTSTGNSGVLASSPSSPVSRGGAAPVSRGGGTGGGAARR